MSNMIGACFSGLLPLPAEQDPRVFTPIFESPARAPLRLQVDANVAALDAIVSTHRGLIAYAQNI